MEHLGKSKHYKGLCGIADKKKAKPDVFKMDALEDDPLDDKKKGVKRKAATGKPKKKGDWIDALFDEEEPEEEEPESESEDQTDEKSSSNASPRKSSSSSSSRSVSPGSGSGSGDAAPPAPPVLPPRRGAPRGPRTAAKAVPQRRVPNKSNCLFDLHGMVPG